MPNRAKMRLNVEPGATGRIEPESSVADNDVPTRRRIEGFS